MAKDIRLTRRHPILATRGEQLELNHKALEGGKPYIDARLSRHRCESDASWDGSKSVTGLRAASGIQGRKERAYCINYAGRIARKLNQLVSLSEVQRDGIGEAFKRDVTATGFSIGQFFGRIGEYLSAAGWCWIGVDRQAAPLDENGNPRPRSIAEREQSGDRIWWTAWRANEVVDWKFAPSGGLEWLITEQVLTEYGSPETEATAQKVRTVWFPGGGVRLYADKDKPDEVARAESFTIGANVIPFVPVGTPSACPWWFDDVEMVSASILNLESCGHENHLQAVFPQLVIPYGLIQSIMEQSGVGVDQAVTMARGLNYPIIEPDVSKGVTRYIQPAAGDMAAIPTEIMRKRRDLFEVVGMALRVESAQVESADAKRLGMMDTQAVLAERAEILQEAEARAVKISKAMDPNFEEYAPVYPTRFDVGDLKEELETLLMLSTLSLPDGAKKELQKVAIDKMAKLGSISRDRVEELKKEADETELAPELAAFAKAPKGKQSAPVADVQSTALNGSQVASLINIAKEAATKGLPIETAKQVAKQSFPAIDDAELDAIFRPLIGFKPAPEPAPSFNPG